MHEEDAFNTITTFRLTYPDYCSLSDPNIAESLLHDSEQADHLCGYTTEMCDILTDVVLQEWFGLRLPPSKLPGGLQIFVPPHLRLVYCLDYSSARQVMTRIRSCYFSRKRRPPDLSIFAGYGLSIPADFQLEREGLLFLARQCDHFRSNDDYLFITQCVYPDGNAQQCK
ncbi:hypothetical protein [Rhodopirellula sp. SWK7]|uniref:hypothetical protein n=1 Tax=Rhodopirellula sp. SWK7 TaxID=595460 RepID=UPI0002BD5C3F|nr:hypothetical protein [Rhodopirellula sp. SWK7]EMI41729.1 hypothetical protein RRSWK_05771 [Rhodopirellula sp. SWK7]